MVSTDVLQSEARGTISDLVIYMLYTIQTQTTVATVDQLLNKFKQFMQTPIFFRTIETSLMVKFDISFFSFSFSDTALGKYACVTQACVTTAAVQFSHTAESSYLL